MGRGRAKAKQAKVARDLKYRTHEPDLGSLAAELHAKQQRGDHESAEGLEEYDDSSPRTD